jgi:Domain of unknown function (DUF4326)
MPRILVAASLDITNRMWLKRCFTSALHQKGVELIQFGDNKALTAVLEDLGFVPISHIRGVSAERRSETRRVVQEADHLLLMWDGRTMTQLLFEARLRSLPTKLFVTEVTTVVNKDRGNEFDVYIGRGTPWGNPYPVGPKEGQYDRGESIELFQRYFESEILNSASLRRGLLGLRGLRLACHCKPLACHGDVIAGYLNSLDPDEFAENPDAKTPGQDELAGGSRRAA